jgi:F-type H+-transporting ATPase subunit a
VADAVVLAIAKIPVGDHVTAKVAGLQFNLDTIWTTAAAGLIVVGLGLLMRRRVTSGVPGRLQLFWETVLGGVSTQVEASLGPRYRRVVPLGVAIFTLILVGNWLEILPGVFHNTDYIPAPTADVNLTYALGILVVVLANVAGIRERGLRGYIGHFFRPSKFLFPINVIEEVVKPFTLALRLFGNLFAGGIMIALIIALFPAYFSWVFTVVWKLFDMFIGVIQAFIFALLTILYYEFATGGGH